MSYDITILFPHPKTGKIDLEFENDAELDNEDITVHTTQQARNREIAHSIHIKYPQYFDIDTSGEGITLNIKSDDDGIIIFPVDIGLYENELSISVPYNSSHSPELINTFVQDCIWQVSQKYDCIIMDSQTGIFHIPLRLMDSYSKNVSEYIQVNPEFKIVGYNQKEGFSLSDDIFATGKQAIDSVVSDIKENEWKKTHPVKAFFAVYLPWFSFILVIKGIIAFINHKYIAMVAYILFAVIWFMVAQSIKYKK